MALRKQGSSSGKGAPSRARAKPGKIKTSGLINQSPPLTIDDHRIRLISVLERRVLNERTSELRDYFALVCSQMHSLSISGAEEALSATIEEDLEQLALLFAHYDLDSDGVLSREEFAALMHLVAEKDSGGTPYSGEHIDRLFGDFDVDANQVIDFNELLLLHNGRRMDA